MDGTTSKMQSFTRPKPMHELLPGLGGIMSKDVKPLPAQTPNSREPVVRKPLTIAEMSSMFMACNRTQTTKQNPRQINTCQKHNWNQTVKVDRTVRHTINGKMNYNSVRKVSKFQLKPKDIETPKSSKPMIKEKNNYLKEKNSVRISGICSIAETPIKSNATYKNMPISNKENVKNPVKNDTKPYITPKANVNLYQKPLVAICNSALSNMSSASSCDASFLQTEKKIQDLMEKNKALEADVIAENIKEVSITASTPYKEYRNNKDIFNNSNDTENTSLFNNNTVMSFDTVKHCGENNEREESVIVSLCDMLNKAAVSNCNEMNMELNDLIKLKKQTEYKIKMIDQSIKTMHTIKEFDLKLLQYLEKIIDVKSKEVSKSENKNETKENKCDIKKETVEPASNHSKACSVIRSCSKSPTYKIPRKNLCLRKKVFHKSMPNVSNGMETPNKASDNKALSIYMKMKEQMNFLHTPSVKSNNAKQPNTPALTSQNLQMQLDKLYNCS